MIYKKKTLDAEGHRVLGWCDACESDIYPQDVHWLVLMPNERKITALCEPCRDWMIDCLNREDQYDEMGMYEFRWGTKVYLIDKVERETMLEQIDDDERIENEGDDEV